jgi:tellurite resistance protein TerC
LGTPALWIGFLLGSALMVALDLVSTRGQSVSPRKAAIWTGVWVTLSLGFAGALALREGGTTGVTWLTAYVIEYALSVDNLFVFIVVFTFFRVSSAAQHRLLYWGILGAFVMRGVLIALGTSLVAKFEWLLYLFGAFLLYTAWKLLFAKTSEDEVDPESNAVLKLARRVLPVTSQDHGLAFFARESNRWKATPLFLVLLVVETTDLLFALDSIPAVLGISKDPFIVFTSNAAAILGLRSLFFVVASLMQSFRFLKVGLGVILGFVGFKLIGETMFHVWVAQHDRALIVASLSFIALTLTASIVASVLFKPRSPETDKPPQAAAPPGLAEKGESSNV